MEPDPEIMEYWSLIPKGDVLDLGVGEGRNAFFLASRGFRVVGIDSSREAAEFCKKKALDSRLPVEVVMADARSFHIEKGRYTCIVCSYLFPFLKYSEILALVRRIKEGLRYKGIAFIRTFTTNDPSYRMLRESGLREVEKNTFFSPKFNMLKWQVARALFITIDLR